MHIIRTFQFAARHFDFSPIDNHQHVLTLNTKFTSRRTSRKLQTLHVLYSYIIDYNKCRVQFVQQWSVFNSSRYNIQRKSSDSLASLPNAFHNNSGWWAALCVVAVGDTGAPTRVDTANRGRRDKTAGNHFCAGEKIVSRQPSVNRVGTAFDRKGDWDKNGCLLGRWIENARSFTNLSIRKRGVTCSFAGISRFRLVVSQRFSGVMFVKIEIYK